MLVSTKSSILKIYILSENSKDKQQGLARMNKDYSACENKRTKVKVGGKKKVNEMSNEDPPICMQ